DLALVADEQPGAGEDLLLLLAIDLLVDEDLPAHDSLVDVDQSDETPTVRIRHAGSLRRSASASRAPTIARCRPGGKRAPRSSLDRFPLRGHSQTRKASDSVERVPLVGAAMLRNQGGRSMAHPATPHTRREFLKSASAVAGAAALSFPAPARAQRPKLVYWCYQFLKASDDARADFAREGGKENNVDVQMTMVPWKEFMPKITAAIEAKATPDVVESGGVELRARGQLLDVTDLYKKAEKTYGGWVGPSSRIMLEPDGRVHTLLYGLQGFMLIARDDLLAQAGLQTP